MESFAGLTTAYGDPTGPMMSITCPISSLLASTTSHLKGGSSVGLLNLTIINLDGVTWITGPKVFKTMRSPIGNHYLIVFLTVSKYI